MQQHTNRVSSTIVINTRRVKSEVCGSETRDLDLVRVVMVWERCYLGKCPRVSDVSHSSLKDTQKLPRGRSEENIPERGLAHAETLIP